MTATLLKHTILGKDSVNTVDLFLSNITGTEAIEVLGNAWRDHVMPQLSNQVIFTGVDLGGDQPITRPYAVAGSVTDPSATVNTAFLVDKNPSTGRRGRWFIAGVAEENVDADGSINLGRRDALNLGLASFISEVNGLGVTLRIARRDGTFAVIESLTCQAQAGSQRRRMRR